MASPTGVSLSLEKKVRCYVSQRWNSFSQNRLYSKLSCKFISTYITVWKSDMFVHLSTRLTDEIKKKTSLLQVDDIITTELTSNLVSKMFPFVRLTMCLCW